LRGDRLKGSRHCRLEALCGWRRKGLHVRNDHRVDDRDEAAVLLDRGLGMDLRHALRLQRFPRLFEKARQLLEARCRIVEALLERCEIPRQQSVDGIPRQAHVVERIPRPFLERVEFEQRRFDFVAEDRGIDLVGTRQRASVDGRERFPVAEESPA
jgi:hypothetical protein